jgi:hypothetical protein
MTLPTDHENNIFKDINTSAILKHSNAVYVQENFFDKTEPL